VKRALDAGIAILDCEFLVAGSGWFDLLKRGKIGVHRDRVGDRSKD
jgi:hypothetical protein